MVDKSRLIASAVIAALAGAAPINESASVADCGRPDAICGPLAPRPDDCHFEHVITAVGTGSGVVMGTGTGTGTAMGAPPGPTLAEAAAMEWRIVTTGTQEGPSLW